MAPVTECLKFKTFNWTTATNKVFEEIKSKMEEAPVLRLLDFLKIIEVACNASYVSVGGVLSQEDHPITFFSENFNEAQQKYSTYNMDFYP